MADGRGGEGGEVIVVVVVVAYNGDINNPTVHTHTHTHVSIFIHARSSSDQHTTTLTFLSAHDSIFRLDVFETKKRKDFLFGFTGDGSANPFRAGWPDAGY